MRLPVRLTTPCWHLVYTSESEQTDGGSDLLRHDRRDQPIRVGFFLDQRFSVVPFVSFVEVLRIANRVADRKLFEWTVLSIDGNSVTTNSQMEFKVDLAISDCDHVPNVVLVTGNDPQYDAPPELANWLRRQNRAGSVLAAFGSASFLLAQLGLLDGRRATIHWEYLDTLREAFPGIDICNTLFEIDGNRITCAGGSAVVDLGLHLIHRHFGVPIAMAVSDQYILDHVRHSAHPQPVGSRHPRVAHAVLAEAIEIMESNLEHPIPLPTLTRTVGVTGKQIQRLFRTYLDTTPRQYYICARLKLARRLLVQSNMNISEVALASGFGSLAHFSRSYRDEFGLPPTKYRRQCRLETGTTSHTHVHKFYDHERHRPLMG